MHDAADTQELIAFRAGGRDYCVDITSVREIRGWTPATPLPQSPSYVRGVINLRGTILPIVDLAERLGLPPVVPTERHVIMVAQSGTSIAGLLVEGVSDILAVSRGAVQPTPEIATESVSGFLNGVLARDDRMIGYVSLERVLPSPSRAAA